MLKKDKLLRNKSPSWPIPFKVFILFSHWTKNYIYIYVCVYVVSLSLSLALFLSLSIYILLYGCTTWTLTKRLEKKLDGNYTRMLRAILNKSWRQHPTRHQLYGHLLPITKTIQVRRARHAGHCWRSRDELIRDVLLWTPTHGRANQDDQHEHTFSSYMRIRGVVLKTYLGRWTIGRSGVRGSRISVLPARDDDDDDDDINVLVNYKIPLVSISTLLSISWDIFSLILTLSYSHIRMGRLYIYI